MQMMQYKDIARHEEWIREIRLDSRNGNIHVEHLIHRRCPVSSLAGTYHQSLLIIAWSSFLLVLYTSGSPCSRCVVSLPFACLCFNAVLQNGLLGRLSSAEKRHP